MSDDETKPEDETKPDADTADDAADKPADLKDEADKAIKEGKSRLGRAYRVAVDKAFGKTWPERLMKLPLLPATIPIFIGNFFKELATVKKERAAAKSEAESEITQEVAKGTETFDIAENLTEEMDKEAHFGPEEKEAVALLTEDVLEAAKATGEPEKALATIDRVKEDADKDEKDTEKLTDEEVQRSFSMGLFTMVRLRQRFDNEKDLAEFLTKVKSAAGKSARFNHFSKYITNNFKKLFQFGAMQVPDLLGIEKSKFLPLLTSEDRLRDGLDIVLPEIFPSAVRDKGLTPLRKFFVRFVRQKRYPDPKALAELIFMIEDEDDMRDLAKKIGGAKVVSLASVKATEDKKAKIKKDREEKAVAKKEGEKGKKEDKPTDKKPDHDEEEPALDEAA